MKILTSSVAILAILAALPASAEESARPADEASLASAIQTVQRMAIQYGVLLSRSFIDLTYDSITVEPGTSDLVLSGLRIYPELDWDPERECVIAIERLLLADPIGFEALEWAISLDGVKLPPACLQPEIAETMIAFGYDGMTIDSATIDVDYHIPSSSAQFGITASVADAAEINFLADFDYLWFRLAADSEGPEDSRPVARLSSVELSVENHGAWQAFEPVLSEQLGGDLSAVPQLAEMGLTEILSEDGHALTAEEQDFVQSVTEQLTRFLRDGDRIVLAATPDRGLLLTEDLLDSPAALIAALNPTISAAPSALQRMIPPAELALALEDDGDELDPESRLRVGEALVTGLGAPLVPSAGRSLLLPLADAWNPKAALLTAEADRALGETESAYEMALRALSGGADGALALADALEAELKLAAILSAQSEAAENWPGAEKAAEEARELLASGNVSGLAKHARKAATGRERPRSYASAYYWASLAAAAGDRGAAALRDRMDARFAGKKGWAETAGKAQDRAIETWTGGLAANIAERAR